MLCRVATVVGALVGWSSATALVLLGITDRVGDETVAQLMLIGLSVALICSACLALQRHQRPLGAAFELGYDMGRRDAIREATRRSNVSPIRRTPKGLSEFNRSAGA